MDVPQQQKKAYLHNLKVSRHAIIKSPYVSQASTMVPESIIRVSLQYLHFAASRPEVTTGQILRVDVGHKRVLSEVCGAATKEGETRWPWNCVAGAGKQAVYEGNCVEEGGAWGCMKYNMRDSLRRKLIQCVTSEELNLRLSFRGTDRHPQKYALQHLVW